MTEASRRQAEREAEASMVPPVDVLPPTTTASTESSAAAAVTSEDALNAVPAPGQGPSPATAVPGPMMPPNMMPPHMIPGAQYAYVYVVSVTVLKSSLFKAKQLSLQSLLQLIPFITTCIFNPRVVHMSRVHCYGCNSCACFDN